MRIQLTSRVEVGMVAVWQAFAQTWAGIKGVATDSPGALAPGGSGDFAGDGRKLAVGDCLQRLLIGGRP